MVKSKKMNKSTIAIIVLSLLLVVSLVLSATGAWFTDWVAGNKENQIIFGKVDVSISDDVITYATEEPSTLANFIPGATVFANGQVSTASTVDSYVYVDSQMYLRKVETAAVGETPAVYSYWKIWMIDATQYEELKAPYELAVSDLTGKTAALTISPVVLSAAIIDEDLDVATATTGWSVLDAEDAPGVYIVDADAVGLVSSVFATYNIKLDEDTINYVLAEEFVLNANNTFSSKAGAPVMLELNGLTGYELIGTLTVRAIQKDFFGDELAASAIYTYMNTFANFDQLAEKFN